MGIDRWEVDWRFDTGVICGKPQGLDAVWHSPCFEKTPMIRRRIELEEVIRTAGHAKDSRRLESVTTSVC